MVWCGSQCGGHQCGGHQLGGTHLAVAHRVHFVDAPLGDVVVAGEGSTQGSTADVVRWASRCALYMRCTQKDIYDRHTDQQTDRSHTIPYHTIPYHTISYHTIPYSIVSYAAHRSTQPLESASECCPVRGGTPGDRVDVREALALARTDGSRTQTAHARLIGSSIVRAGILWTISVLGASSVWNICHRRNWVPRGSLT